MLSICYHMLSITSASPVFMRVSAKTVLFQLYSSGRLTGNVVEHAVDSFHLIDNAVHSGLEDIPGNLCRLCSHKVAGDDSAQDDGQAVGAVVAHDSDAVHVGEGGKILTEILVHTGFVKLFPEDIVGILHDLDLVGCDLTHNADGESRTGEGLTVDQLPGDAQFKAYPAHFVLKEHAERFDRSFVKAQFTDEFDGKSADIVVGFDDIASLAVAALDDIRIDCPLGKITDLSFEFPGFFSENTRKLLSDNLPLDLGIGLADQAAIESLLGVDADKMQVKAAIIFRLISGSVWPIRRR